MLRPTPAEVIRQVRLEIETVLSRSRLSIDECSSGTKARAVCEAREDLACIATERLRPIGMSDVEIARFLGMKRTTMVYALRRFRKRQGYDRG
jgi:CRP-like cAMP-binding protein